MLEHVASINEVMATLTWSGHDDVIQEKLVVLRLGVVLHFDLNQVNTDI